jgi:hypothetical protein
METEKERERTSNPSLRKKAKLTISFSKNKITHHGIIHQNLKIYISKLIPSDKTT